MSGSVLLDIAPWLLQILAAEFVNGWTDAPNANDGQKFIGVFTLALVLGGILPTFQVPAWAIVLLFLTASVIAALAALTILACLPADHFMDPRYRRRAKPRHPMLRVVLFVVKNLAGWLLIAVGLFLSIPGVPGQGLLTILMGVLLIDFPAKYRVERWLVSRRGVLPLLTRLRTRLGRPPLELP